MATTRTEKPNEPIILHFEWTSKKSDDVDTAITALKVSTDHQLAHCPGVETYAFRRINDNTIRMTEVYRDAKAFWSHIPSGSYVSDKLQFLFDTSVRERAIGVGVGQLPEGVEATVKMMGGHSSPLMSGFVCSPSFSPLSVKPVLLTMVIKNGFEEASRDLVLKTLDPLVSAAAKNQEVRTCAVFHNNNDIQVMVIAASDTTIASVLALAKLDALHGKFHIDAEICGAISTESHKQILDTGLTFNANSQLDAGYVLHPTCFNGSRANVDTALQSSSLPEPPTTEQFALVIDPYTKEATAIRFSQSAPGRSAHQYKPGTTPQVVAAEGTLEVPLLHLVRKLSNSGATDLELPIPKLFGLLERLRSWQRSIVLFNRLFSNGEQLTEEEQYFVETFVENLHNVGYPQRAKDKRVNIEGLNEFIQTIEWAMRDVIEPARNSLATTQQVTYKGLMEAFPIGSVVVGQAGGLGGALVAYRVFDCYMSTQRSMFGTSKYIFTIGLEFVVNLGAHFCVCNFEDKFEEFEGERDLRGLPYVPLTSRANEKSMLISRGKAVAELGVRPVYRSYASGAFFAHLAGSSNGAASTGVHQAGSGRCMVDNERGLMLGHAPGVSYDGAGIAIQSTIKVYRVAVRASHENESEAAKQERIKNAQLRLFKHLPSHFEVITWPAVVAYSFTWKTWGHVLTSGLNEVQFSDEPWNQLVLPKRTKELLFASALFNLSGAPGVGDLIKGKSQGALYLLYGPPGTGKTLTVEAISEKFKLPLYTVSLGELGTGAQEVDAAINNILALCAQWKAIVLLDEGDALLEQREKGKLQMNSLTGVLLRSLENFDGQLFITSNRLQHIDRAVLSRVTLAIKYDALDAAARASIWRNTLTRAGVDLSNLDIEALAQYEISGRELLHIVKLGLALAFYHKSPLTQELIVAALEESLEFRSHFPTTSY